MRNRVMITDTKFHVDAENKVVVCELKCDLQMPKHPSWIVLQDDMYRRKFPNVGYSGEFTVKAKARCNNIDTFDEKKGKMIAESRAKAKMFNIAWRVWRECEDALADLAQECQKTSQACVKAMDIELNHVRELSV